MYEGRERNNTGKAKGNMNRLSKKCDRKDTSLLLTLTFRETWNKEYTVASGSGGKKADQ